ncbi:lytic transglycosylase domain-containing protein [Salmonella enterica]|nr:lytic transglycosylase domain-containing protein [Salmonella enterica]
MAAKSIVEIDVQDEKFQSFLEKFNEYQKALSELPEQWRGAVHGLGEAAKETERVRDGTEGITKAFADGVAALASVNDGLDRLNGNLEKATKTQTEFNRKSGGARNFLNKASKDAKSLAGHIKDATTSLLSWGTVLGLFSGLAGAGGLWGLNHLAGNASAQRFTAMGLGTTAGGLNSTAVDFQKALGNPVGTLGAIRDAQLDLSKRWQFRAMGVDNPDRDPAELLPEMIKAARDIFVRNGSTQQGAEAYGLTNYFTLDDLNRFKKMSDEEIDAMAKQAQQDTRRLQLTDQQLRQWQDFNIQLDRSKVSIGNTFIRGLAPLAPELGKLSDAFSGAIETVLKSPELGKWIDGLSDGIRRFGNYLASTEFQKDVEAFINNIHDIISKWAPSNENNTKVYIGHVVNSTGRSEFEKLNLNDTRTLAKLITAMSVKEGAGSRLSEGKVIQIINNAGGHFQESQKKSLQYINPSDSVRGQYLAQYGSELPGTSTSNPVVQPVQQGSGKTDQILQQILDNQKRGHAQGLVVYNNTGGNAVVSSTQLGGFG